MFGYSITINGREKFDQTDIHYKNIVCTNFMINKFKNDKIFEETDEFIVILDGIIINRNELIKMLFPIETGGNTDVWLKTIIQLYHQKGETFFSGLRGSFSGALYDKNKDKWIIFCDQIGSRFTYYAHIGDLFCCSEVMGYMYELLKNNGKHYNLDNTGAKLMLTYGYMLDDITLCEEIKKINPGCYITLQDNKIVEHRYYMLDNTPDNTIKQNDAIETVDYYFRQAIKREFEKDIEYGYKHLVALSGGLDCRMTSFVAHDCGYTNQLNYTFSQNGYWDQILPQRMSSYLKHEWIYKALDNGLWLMDADEVNRFSGGNVIYYHIAHSNSLFKYINFDTLGVVHTGQIGDVIIGSFIKAHDITKKYQLGIKANSTKYLSHIQDLKLSLDVNKEIGMFYYRAFHGTNNGIQHFYNYTETLSPFLDLDFLEKCLTIPVSIRQNHNLYKQWILAKYPDAADFEWETIGCKITAPTIRMGNKEIPVKNIPNSLISHLRIKLGLNNDRKNVINMHPLANYISTNSELSQYIDGCFAYAEFLDPELTQIVFDIRKSGTAQEKIQAVTLLSAIKMFFV